MIEGVWAHYCGLGLPDGDFGLGKSCPGMHGEQEDCMVRFDGNFLHLPNSTAQCAGGYSKKHYNKGHWVGGNSTVRAARVCAWTFALPVPSCRLQGDVFIAPSAPLTPEAAAIADAAGPR